MSKDETCIDQARRDLVSSGGSEVDVRQNLPSMTELWDEIQILRAEMNKAKKKASQEAAEPFLERITELEDQYALALKLLS